MAELGVQIIDHEMVPDSAGRVTVSIPVVAADVLRAWDTDMQLKALHEAGHAVASAVLGMEITMIDITKRYGGCTILGEGSDTSPAIQRGSDQFKEIVIALSGRAAEITILGEPTDGNGNDFSHASTLAANRFVWAMDTDSPLAGIDPHDFAIPPATLMDAMLKSVEATFAKAAQQADAIMSEHREQLVELAQLIYKARRLTDRGLAAALAEVGLEGARIRTEA